jgi:hypothetical protein
MNQDIVIDIPFDKNGQVKHEDAPPVTLPNLIAVADGLGGEGAILHTLPDFSSYEQFLSVFFVNHPHKKLIFNDPDILAYTKLSFDSVIKQKKLTNSGAYFGSRFLMLHLICYAKYDLSLHFKDNEKAINFHLVIKEDLEAYLKKQLVDSIISLNPKQDYTIPNKSYFPTTVSGCFLINKGEQTEVISFYAGDSKGFMINQDGFFAISKDHEKDNNAGMSNLIFVNFSKQWVTGNFFIETRLIQKQTPFCILQVSDGFFDPLMNPDSLRMKVQLPLNFLNILQSSDSVDAYHQNLTKFYGDPSGEFTGDDRTLAMRFIGFKNFEDIKNFLLVKNDLLSKYQRLSNILDKHIDLILLDNNYDQTIRNLIMDYNLMDRFKGLLTHDVIRNDTFNLKKFDGFRQLSDLVLDSESSEIKLYESFSFFFKEQHHQIIELLINFNELQKISLKNFSSLASDYYQSYQKLVQLKDELILLSNNLERLDKALKENAIENQKKMMSALNTIKVSKFNQEEANYIRKVFSEINQLQNDILFTLDFYSIGQLKKTTIFSSQLNHDKHLKYLSIKESLVSNNKQIANLEAKMITSKESLLNDIIIKAIFNELVKNSSGFPYLFNLLKSKKIYLQTNSSTKLNAAVNTFINNQIIAIVKYVIKQNDVSLLNAFSIHSKEITNINNVMNALSKSESETLEDFDRSFDQYIS